MKNENTKLSIYLSGILRHRPEEIGEPHEVMDIHGWVGVDTLIKGVNDKGKFRVTKELLETIVENDEKGRYRFNENHTRIKCCQGHSIEWVIPELSSKAPPEFLYHGTTVESLRKIMASGHISKMKRHAVHMQADFEKAKQSAQRRHVPAVVLKIAALELHRAGTEFGVSENGVWCAESVPTEYITEFIYL